jgi:ATP-binding cassette subfamily B protein/ATP-binding cassette subfamily C protein
MRDLLVIAAAMRRSIRGGLAVRLTIVLALSALSGATAGVLPGIVGVAMNTILERAAPMNAGIGRVFGRILQGAGAWTTIGVTLVVTLATVAISVLSSQRGSELAGEVTAALRIEMLKAALFASPRDVEAVGQLGATAKAGPKPPPGVKAPEVRGTEIVKLAIARDSGLSADFTVAFMTGLPQAGVTLAVLAWELISGGTWLVLAGGLGLFLLSRILSDGASRRVAHQMQQMQRADAAIFSGLGETLSATEDLRLLGAREQATLDFAGSAHHAADARRTFTRALAVAGQIKSVFTAISPLLILIALKLSGRSHDAGDVAKLMLMMPLLMARLEALDGLRTGLIEREPVLRATAALLALPAYPAEPNDPAPLAAISAGTITLDRVSFTPPGAARPILDELSLTIPAGSVVGICGPSGCGKSTLLRLLLRLDEPDSGAIALDGTDLRRISPGELPKVFAVLGQASRLLERSIARNLSLGLDPPPPEAQMLQTLERVQLGELSSGDRTLATQFRAVPPNFSGGEQRRLLLARMLLRDARMFVLDEPEAGLPSATAEEILRAVGKLSAGRTCVVVTHAPHLLASTFNVVLDKGKVAAIGTHEELSASCETYRALLAEGLKAAKPGPAAPPQLGPAQPPGLQNAVR